MVQMKIEKPTAAPAPAPIAPCAPPGFRIGAFTKTVWDRRLSPTAKLVGLLLAREWKKDVGVVVLKSEDVSRLTGLGRTAVRLALAELGDEELVETIGYVRVDRGGVPIWDTFVDTKSERGRGWVTVRALHAPDEKGAAS